MKVVAKHLPLKEYYQEDTPKHQIVLHHTVSMSFKSTYSWWLQDGIHVGVAYVIDKDGTIYEMFNPKYWAYHLGKGTNALNNKSAIGIETVNEGPLWFKNEKYYWWDGSYEFHGPTFDNKEYWRNHRYWAAYNDVQIDSLVSLLKFLMSVFNINSNIISTYDYDKSLLYENCIISHHNVRRDKTDVSVALDLKKLNERINE